VNQAGAGAISATGALVLINVSGLLANSYLKMTLFTGDAFNLGTGNEIDIEMLADLDQFGRNDSHGTVIGGKRLVESCHGPADGGTSFNKVDIIA